nr:uncharacterized mitochondrial protein AtMg00810-like [Tanacetum cinerariifolium]
SKWVFRNKKDERGIVIRNKARIMDVKSAFLYGTIKEEVYVYQLLGFEDPDYPDKIYKVLKALYGLHQTPRACQDKYVAKILRKFGFTDVKSDSTPIEIEKPLLKDPDGDDVDVRIYRSMIGSLIYLTSSRPDIMFSVCACVRFQVTPKVSHLHAIKRIFIYLKGKPHLGLWYPRDSPFNLVAYSDSDYAGASLDRKSTIGGYQFLGCRLISWQCKKQTVVATSSTEAEYVAAASCCAQVLWIQNQLLDYGSQVNAVKGITINNSIDGLNHLCLQTSSRETDQTLNLHLISHFSSPPKNTMTPLTFADIHNMVSFLSKSDASDGFDQIVDFLNAHTIKWLSEAIIRRDLHLDDADEVECLPNAKIFEELGRMGYEKPPPKLTFYKAFFSAQWKFLIHTLVQCLSDKRTAWNEFSCSMESAVICLATVVLDHQVDDMTTHNTRYTSFALTQKVFANIRRVGKVFSGVETPLFDSMLVQAQPQAGEGVEIPITPAPPSTTSAPSPTDLQDPTPTPHDSPSQDQPTTPHESSMPLLTTLMETCATLLQKKSKTQGLKRQRRVGAGQRVDSSTDTVLGAQEDASKQGGKIAAIDADEGITLVDVETDEEVVAMDAESQERLNQEDVNAASKEVSAVSALELVSAAEPTMFNDEDVTMTMAQTLIKLKIISVGGITKTYQIFKDMLKGFDKEDLIALWNLVKEKFSSAEPSEDKEKALWVELKRRDCEVHHVSSTRAHDIFLLTEKDYPLSNAVMILMLSERLHVKEDNEMARDLVMKIFMEANKPRSRSLDTSS